MVDVSKKLRVNLAELAAENDFGAMLEQAAHRFSEAGGAIDTAYLTLVISDGEGTIGAADARFDLENFARRFATFARKDDQPVEVVFTEPATVKTLLDQAGITLAEGEAVFDGDAECELDDEFGPADDDNLVFTIRPSGSVEE